MKSVARLVQFVTLFIRHPDAAFWNAFVAIGSDVTIDISKIRAAELQRSISESEPGCLNLPPLVESGTIRNHIMRLFLFV